MPKLEDYECFRDEIEEFKLRAEAPDKPTLVLLIYITRSQEKLLAPFIPGRPNIGRVYRDMLQGRPKGQRSLVFACGPQPLVAELWDKSISYTLKGRHIDFHHEIFEF
jgi:hypothetical protein